LFFSAAQNCAILDGVKLAKGPTTEDTMAIPSHDPDRAKLREVLKEVEHVRGECKQNHEVVKKLDLIKQLITEVQV
jgi:hypothetical protein